MAVSTTTRPALGAESIEALFRAAEASSQHAYAKYSEFRVGAALLSASGKIYTGCNVENISYPIGTCAEEAAIAAARTAEGQSLKAVALAVHATYKAQGHVPCTPCGACRQRILELGRDVIVCFYDASLKRQKFSADELLPHAFSF